MIKSLEDLAQDWRMYYLLRHEPRQLWKMQIQSRWSFLVPPYFAFRLFQAACSKSARDFKEKALESSKPVIATRRVRESIVAKTVKKTMVPWKCGAMKLSGIIISKINCVSAYVSFLTCFLNSSWSISSWWFIRIFPIQSGQGSLFQSRTHGCQRVICYTVLSVGIYGNQAWTRGLLKPLAKCSWRRHTSIYIYI